MKYYHAKRGGNGIALSIIELGARRGWVINTTTWPPYPQEKRTIAHHTAGLDSGAVWTSRENLAPTAVRTPGK